MINICHNECNLNRATIQMCKSLQMNYNHKSNDMVSSEKYAIKQYKEAG